MATCFDCIESLSGLPKNRYNVSTFIVHSGIPNAYNILCFFTTHYTLRLIVRSELDVSTFATRRLHAFHHAIAPSGGMRNCGRKMSSNFCLNADFHVTFRDLLHAVKLRHGTDDFTSPPKEGVLRIFFALKTRRLRPGVKSRTWVPKASMLPLDHRSHKRLH